MLKHAESHRCEVDKVGKLAGTFSRFFSRWDFLENRLMNPNGVKILARKNSNNN